VDFVFRHPASHNLSILFSEWDEIPIRAREQPALYRYGDLAADRA